MQDNLLLKTKDQNSLTAVERMRLKKEQKAREEFEMMKKAASNAWENQAQAKQHMQNQLQSSMMSLKGTVKADAFNGSQTRFNESLDQSRDSDTDAYNNASRTIQYTERSQFQEDVNNAPKPQATEYGKPFLQESKKDYLQKPQFISLV